MDLSALEDSFSEALHLALTIPLPLTLTLILIGGPPRRNHCSEAAEGVVRPFDRTWTPAILAMRRQ